MQSHVINYNITILKNAIGFFNFFIFIYNYLFIDFNSLFIVYFCFTYIFLKTLHNIIGDIIMNKYEINIYEQIARNIKKYRIISGITQAVLAEKVGVSHEFIRRIESKKGIKTFSVDTIWKISLALDIGIEKLFEIDIDEFNNIKK